MAPRGPVLCAPAQRLRAEPAGRGLSTRTSGRRDGAGGGDGGERGTVGTDGTDGTDGADGAGGTTNCRRCADGLRRGLGSFTMGKPALRPSPAAGACHVGSVPKGSIFLSFRKKMDQDPSPLEWNSFYFHRSRAVNQPPRGSIYDACRATALFLPCVQGIGTADRSSDQMFRFPAHRVKIVQWLCTHQMTRTLCLGPP